MNQSMRWYDDKPWVTQALRRGFRWLNRYFMVPSFRLGLAPLMGSPYGGYILVLKTIGRKTGKVRPAPLNYAIIKGNVYCLAGFGSVAHWYENLKVQPAVELLMSGGAFAGIAEDVTDADEKLHAARQILINGGFAGFAFGFNPATVSDTKLRQTIADLPVIRIRLVGLGNGAGDPGGWAWAWWLVALVWLLMWWGKKKQREP